MDWSHIWASKSPGRFVICPLVMWLCTSYLVVSNFDRLVTQPLVLVGLKKTTKRGLRYNRVCVRVGFQGNVVKPLIAHENRHHTAIYAYVEFWK